MKNVLQQKLKGLLGCILFVCIFAATSQPAMCQTNADAQTYANKITADPQVYGQGYEGIYWELIRKGKAPVDAYRATYIYEKGYEIGYYYGFMHVYSKGQQPADKYQTYFSWIGYYQQAAWSQRLWGWFQQGYLDGQLRGMRVAAGQEAGTANGSIPKPAPGEVGRYQKSLPVDPDDPWSDLRIREQITGPK